MKCMKCGAPMIKATLNGMMAPVWLSNKQPGIFEEEKRSSVSTFVCPLCGYIELKADNPMALRLPSEKT